MLCKKCGKEISENVKFCPNCGESNNSSMVHPAGTFMWSIALGGPIIAWAVHSKELNKESHLSFFWPMLGWSLFLSIPDRILNVIPISNSIILLILSLLLFIATRYFIGVLGAKKIRECLPEYPYFTYKKREKYGIIAGIIVMCAFLYLSYLYGI